MNRDFKGIWIPKEIWLHSKISIQAKALWAEIDSLYCEERGGCYASDESLSQFLGLGLRRIQEILKELRKNKLLVTATKDSRNRIMKALSLKTASSKSSNFCKESEPSTLSRAFLGIWIPRKIWLYPEISLQAKALWAGIDPLSCEKRDGCYASDQDLMKFLGIKVSRLHEILKELKDNNLLVYTNKDKRNRVMKTVNPEANESVTSGKSDPLYIRNLTKKKEREASASNPSVSSVSSAKITQKSSCKELNNINLAQQEAL